MFTARRRDFLVAASAGLGAASLGAVAVGGCSRTGGSREEPAAHGEHTINEETAGLSPSQALARLKDGNARFVAMTEIEPNQSSTRLMAISNGQQPFVCVLGCVDSRVPPELIFDRGLGDVFDARIAGAVADDAAIGSLEFGVEEFGVPLLVVLGHSRCGAVTAAVKAVQSGQTRQPGRIGAVVDLIIPAIETVATRGASADDLVDTAAREVVRRGVGALTNSPVLKDRVASGNLDIVGAFYDLDTGRVEFGPR